jgi:hypothetical protein
MPYVSEGLCPLVIAQDCENQSMPWTCPQSGRSRVNTAGDIISGRESATQQFDLDTAYDVAGNWRSSHGYPLNVAWTQLTKRAREIDPKSLTAKRIKRLPSIIAKLQREKDMQFARMHDLGGCRAILANVKHVDELVALYQKEPPQAYEFVKPYDYIAKPKIDGYRSIHLVYKYQGESQQGAFKTLRIEIQIRTRLQHAWATALEIVDAFTGQGLKSRGGEEPWRRFFLLVSAAMSIAEKCPVAPNAPEDIEALRSELMQLCQQLKITDIFEGLTTGMETAKTMRLKRGQQTEAYILILNSQERATRTIRFATINAAESTLLELEKENVGKPHIQVVMASANSMQALPKAYPNYYADTHAFLSFIEKLLSPNGKPGVESAHDANAKDEAPQ